MILKHLKVANYRNHEASELTPVNGVNCLVGQNGMGKTNILDAIYFLCMTKSHISGQDKSLVRHDAEFLRVEGKFDRENEPIKIVSKIQTSKKKFERDDVSYKKLADHIGLLPVVVYSPKEIAIVNEGSIERRRFLDNGLSQIDPLYLKHLLVYRKVKKQRDALLHEFADKRYFDQTLISTFDEQLIPPANYIASKRQEFITSFLPIFTNLYNEISNGQEEVSIRYKSKMLEVPFEELLKQNLEKDKALRRTSVGIHKDDLSFFINDTPLKQYASQGQIKSFILALKIAQYEMLKAKIKTAPILLFDDIFDKLDLKRAQHLLALIRKRTLGQIFITDTDNTRVELIVKEAGLEFKIFNIDNGQIINQN